MAIHISASVARTQHFVGGGGRVKRDCRMGLVTLCWVKATVSRALDLRVYIVGMKLSFADDRNAEKLKESKHVAL
jgi:hypothetical protein